MTKPLIQNLDTMAKGALLDEYLALAHTIENSLIASGAVPGEDYKILDLFQLAQPFALQLFKERDGMEYSYPCKNVI